MEQSTLLFKMENLGSERLNITPKISLQKAARLKLKPRIITFQRVIFNSPYYVVLANTSGADVHNLPSLRHLSVIL